MKVPLALVVLVWGAFLIYMSDRDHYDCAFQRASCMVLGDCEGLPASA